MIPKILFFTFRLLARWRLPRAAAYLVALVSYWMPMRISAAGSSPRYRALIMIRPAFAQDVEESFQDSDEFKLIPWPNFALKAFASAILAPTLDHNHYLTDDPVEKATKAEYRDFLRKLWRHFLAVRPVDVVLTGNFGYFTEREFATVLEEAGTPFIALHKENLKSPGRVKFWQSIYTERRGKFTGRKILVYNDVERDLQISSGVMDSENIAVTGMPRLDKFHRWRRAHAAPKPELSRPSVLFFAFDRADKLPAIRRKPAAGVPGNVEPMGEQWGGILSWAQLGDELHRAVVRLARKRPDLDIIVKTKDRLRRQKDIMEMLSATGEELPANLLLVTSGDPFDLVAAAKVVIGFNTSGLLEALAAGKPVVVPWFGEACNPDMREHIIELGGAVDYGYSPDELIEHVCRHADAPSSAPLELRTETAAALRHWAGNDDGASGHRVRASIRAEIDQLRK